MRVQDPSTTTIGLPSQRVVQMRYSSWKQLAGTSGAFGTQVVAANSINDPDSTGIGHQALGNDQWALFYQSYVVLRSRITVKLGVHSGATLPVIAGIYLSSSSTVTGPWDALVEQGKSTVCFLQPSVGVPPSELSLSFDAKTAFNVRDVRDEVQRIGAHFNSSPSDRMFFVCWSQSMDQSSTGGCDLMYYIDYDVLVSEPLLLAQS